MYSQVKQVKRKIKQEQEELDYEEEFADDEDIDFGIEDQEEARDASKRLYGKGAKKSFLFGDTSDLSDLEQEEKGMNSTEKAFAKVLRKLEKSDTYDVDEENPYISDLVFFLFCIPFHKNRMKKNQKSNQSQFILFLTFQI